MNLILGSCDNYGWTNIKHWANSIRQSGFTGRVALIVYRVQDQELVDNCKRLNIELYQSSSNYRGAPIDHHETGHATMIQRNRFFDYWQFLSNEDIDTLGWIIHTDVGDVVFQSDPDAYLELIEADERVNKFPILGSSEGVFYFRKDMFDVESWNVADLQRAFGAIVLNGVFGHGQLNVINAGVLVARPAVFRDLSLAIFFMARGQEEAADQAALNVLTQTLLKSQTFVIPHDAGWACQCGTVLAKPNSMELKPIVRDDGVVVVGSHTSKLRSNSLSGTPYVIVHQYNRLPQARLISSRYDS